MWLEISQSEYEMYVLLSDGQRSEQPDYQFLQTHKEGASEQEYWHQNKSVYVYYGLMNADKYVKCVTYYVFNVINC